MTSSDYLYQSLLDVAVLPNGICDLGPRLVTMTGILRLWMTFHFGSANNVIDKLLKPYLWNADDKLTQISIEAADRFDVHQTENRPAIILKRQDWKKIRLGIADLSMGIPASGSRHYANWWQGSHSVFCISKVEGQAESLATEVFRDLNEFAQAVRQQLDLKRLEVAGISKCGILEESSGKAFCSVIEVAYVLEESWVLRQVAPFLKKIDMTVMQLPQA